MTPVKFDQHTHVISTTFGDTPIMFDVVSGATVVQLQLSPDELTKLNENGGQLNIVTKYPINLPYPVLTIAPEIEFREASETEKEAVVLRAKKERTKALREKRNRK